jgi:NAD(P)-dependent dehydrogenase (short-subunit alcohol dehydrogenase family)
MRGLSGKVAIVTGANGRMGEAILVRLAEEGCRVLGVGRNSDTGEAIAEKVRSSGGTASFVVADVGVETDVRHSVEKAVELYGRLDIVVNNAAAIEREYGKSDSDGPITGLETTKLEQVMKVNLFGPFWYAKYAIPEMLKLGGGSFVNISSTAATRGLRGVTAYATSKSALDGLTRSLAADYGPVNIRANLIAPSGIRTHPHYEARWDAAPDEFERQRILPRWGTGQDIAAVVAFLVSDDSGYVTGAVIPVDGGAMIKWPSPGPWVTLEALGG